jgi:hypothetical protein
MDGVLVDFAGGVARIMECCVPIEEHFPYSEYLYETCQQTRERMWKVADDYQNIHGGELWGDADPMDDAFDLWDHIAPYQPEILSATGNPKYGAVDQKRRWVDRYLGEHVVVNTTQRAAEKARYAAPNHILIDDKMKAIGPWREAGGIGILHMYAEDTIKQLRELGF